MKDLNSLASEIHTMDYSPESILSACHYLQKGGVIAYPTEAVWGLGCDPFNAQAVKQLWTLKRRAEEKGLIVVAGQLSELNPFIAELTPEAQQRIAHERHVVGSEQAITWLIDTHADVPRWISGVHAEVAIRLSTHVLIERLCAGFGRAIVSTSANLSGHPPALTQQQAYDYFGEAVHYVNGNVGGASQPSRIIRLATDEIIRA